MLISLKKAAEQLDTSERHARTLCREGLLPFVRVGPRLIRVDLADLETFIAANRCGGPGLGDADRPCGPQADRMEGAA
jgi:excisionase family DNA binding protein